MLQLHFPGALAMILSGMLLRNVNNGIIISGLVPSWSKQIRAAALAIIFLRSGLEIDLDVRLPLSPHTYLSPDHICPEIAWESDCDREGCRPCVAASYMEEPCLPIRCEQGPEWSCASPGEQGHLQQKLLLVPGRAAASFYAIAAKPIFDMSVKRPSKGFCDSCCTACCQLPMRVRWVTCCCRSSGEWARLQ